MVLLGIWGFNIAAGGWQMPTLRVAGKNHKKLHIGERERREAVRFNVGLKGSKEGK
jgi:hypothetical protein